MENDTGQSIKDIIFENVSMSGFTFGIKADGHSVSNIKLRGVRPFANYRQLVIKAKHSYDWDIQNLNFTGMLPLVEIQKELEDEIVRQAGVEINTTGAPATYTGENKNIKFLQLNCNGFATTVADYANRPGFCISIDEHDGLFFKQLHAEGVLQSMIVKQLPIGKSNDEPIVMENSVAAGEFYDESMKLYLIGNVTFVAPDPIVAQQQTHSDKARLEFIGNGTKSKLVDCGDQHMDRTNTFVDEDPDDGMNEVTYADWRMQFTHSERNREGFFAKTASGSYYPMRHKVCPSGVTGYTPNIEEIGGENFNSGVLPLEDHLPFTNHISSADCIGGAADCTNKMNTVMQQNLDNGKPNNGTVAIVGQVVVDDEIVIPSGKQIIGVRKDLGSGNYQEPELKLVPKPTATNDLIKIVTPLDARRISGITIRNLKISTTDNSSNGIAIVGTNNNITGVSSDMHFSGLTIEGFGKGLDVRVNGPENQMVDGVSWKNVNFIDNQTAASVVPSNVSNWNIINLNIESSKSNAVGWYHVNTGSSIQNVSCKGTGTENNLLDCIKLESASIHLSGLKKTDKVVNDLTFTQHPIYSSIFTEQYESAVFYNSVLRNNDFTGNSNGIVKFKGKTNITSMNNTYRKFDVSTTVGDFGKFSRVTYCSDTFLDDPAFDGIDNNYDSLYVGVPISSLIKCSNYDNEPNPKPWEDVINWGDEDDKPSKAIDHPLVGNIINNGADDLVIFREMPDIGGVKQQSYFRVSSTDGKTNQVIPWGLTEDVPLVGKINAGTRDQLIVVREVANSTSQWYVYEPTGGYDVYYWGIEGDIPFVGNFIDDSGNLDDIAIYRPLTKQFWILNPKNQSVTVNFTIANNHGDKIQVGDFLGEGFEQVAHYVDGTWHIVNPVSPFNSYTASLGGAYDIPIAGNYLTGACTQLGVWSEATEQFIIKDPVLTPTPSPNNCNNHPEQSMYWGSNNNSTYVGYIGCPNGNCLNDVPLKVKKTGSSLDRPTSYRPTNGVFPYSKAKGQWWIHDPF